LVSILPVMFLLFSVSMFGFQKSFTC